MVESTVDVLVKDGKPSGFEDFVRHTEKESNYNSLNSTECQQASSGGYKDTSGMQVRR